MPLPCNASARCFGGASLAQHDRKLFGCVPLIDLYDSFLFFSSFRENLFFLFRRGDQWSPAFVGKTELLLSFRTKPRNLVETNAEA